MIKKGLHAPQKHTLLIGAHTSIAGGLQHALYEGASIGCTCIQMFTHSNRQWGMPPLSPQDRDAFAQARKKTGIHEIMVHASYLINIASADPIVYKKSKSALRSQLIRCEELEIPLLVLHPGSAVEQSRQQGLERIVATLKELFEEVPFQHTTLLLENMAGQGSVLGATLEELAYLYHESTPHKRLGVCIDLCHAFVAGYSLDTPHGYEQFWHDFDALIGLRHLKALHMNDSQKKLGSHADRHADIGKGELGLETFKRIMHDKRFFDIPKVLETPRETLADHARNLELLRKLAS